VFITRWLARPDRINDHLCMPVEVASEAGSLLKLLGEPLRWEIVRCLAAEELCTCHLVAELDAAQPLISHHLRVLRQAGVVRAEQAGAFTYYVLDRSVVAGLAGVLTDLASERGPTRRRPCT
jgi:ArsR family transcriptional regulator, arsenate/arsenite/antimonite-responsive transcriptional repressor